MRKDGNVDYVRGSLLLNNDRGKEAVEALRQAVAKGGLKQPGEAYILLGDAENNENNSAGATAAWEKAKGYPSTKTDGRAAPEERQERQGARHQAQQTVMLRRSEAFAAGPRRPCCALALVSARQVV